MKLADMVDCGTAHISRIENGSVYPSVNLLERILRTLDIHSYINITQRDSYRANLIHAILDKTKDLPKKDLEIINKMIDILLERV